MKKSIKLILTILITLFILLITNNYVQAATTDFSPTTTTVEVGDTITVTATVTAAQWDLSIKVNGDSIATLTELDNYKSNITKSFSGTYKATEKGEVIGTEKSYKKSMKKIEIAFPENKDATKTAASITFN